MSPFVIILEGPNGTGKSTLSRMIADNAAGSLEPYGRVIRYRAFERALTGDATAIGARETLKSAAVPLNTHVDDFYVADAINNMLGREDLVILDRSLPSGIAYARAGIERSGTVTGNSGPILTADQRARDAPEHIWRCWVHTWSEMLTRRLYITLQVSYRTARERTAERSRWFPTPEQHEKLEAQFLLIHSMMAGPRMLIDTETLSLSQIMSSILENIPRAR